MARKKIETIEENDAVFLGDAAEETPAGVTVGYVKDWKRVRDGLERRLAEAQHRLEMARAEVKQWTNLFDAHIHRAPDERPEGDLPILDGIEDADTPAGFVKVSVSLDDGDAAAHAVMDAVREKLTTEEFARWLEDFQIEVAVE